MKVELIAFTSPVHGKNPMDVVEQAASVCYDSKPTESHKIAKACKKSGHTSVFEHISFTFHISGVSRAFLAQITRHRHLSFSVRSQRYCSEEDFMYVNPFDTYSDKSFLLGDCMHGISETYAHLINMGAKNEDARAILPNACCTEMYVSGNARAFIEASHLRLCSRAQKEIREVFWQMKKELELVCPEIAAYMVPSCERDPEHPYCPEGKSCGRHKTLAEVYNPTQESTVY